MEVAFAPDFLDAVRIARVVELRPALCDIGVATFDEINAVRAFEDCLRLGRNSVLDLGSDERATTANTFGVDMGVSFGNTGVCQGTDEAASSTAGDGPGD